MEIVFDKTHQNQERKYVGYVDTRSVMRAHSAPYLQRLASDEAVQRGRRRHGRWRSTRGMCTVCLDSG